jgi:hypothetical protein
VPKHRGRIAGRRDVIAPIFGPRVLFYASFGELLTADAVWDFLHPRAREAGFLGTQDGRAR